MPAAERGDDEGEIDLVVDLVDGFDLRSDWKWVGVMPSSDRPRLMPDHLIDQRVCANKLLL